MIDITNGHSMTYNLLGNNYQVNVVKNEYRNGGTAIQLVDAEDGMPFATATIWIEGLAKDEVAIKDYSENAGMLAFLLENGIVENPSRIVDNGFVNIPVCKLK
jgi:outer membrane lipoprotein-sorting protein